jgi:tetratricopeptide (TPR) repeat protein
VPLFVTITPLAPFAAYYLKATAGLMAASIMLLTMLTYFGVIAANWLMRAHMDQHGAIPFFRLSYAFFGLIATGWMLFLQSGGRWLIMLPFLYFLQGFASACWMSISDCGARRRESRQEGGEEPQTPRAVRRGDATAVIAAERLRRSQSEQAGERSRRLEAEVARAREQIVVADRAQRRMAALAPYTEATDLLRRAEMLDNALADDLGRRSQLTDQAILRLRDALATEPEFIEARYALGEALRTAGRPLEAASEFLAADAIALTFAFPA